MVRIGYWATLCYVFVSYSRIAELLAPGIRLAAVLAAIAIAMALVSGRFVNVLRSKIGTGYLALTFLFALGVPFGSYSMGTLGVLVTDWARHFALFVLVAALVPSRKKCLTLMITVAVASTAAAVCAMLKGSTMEGRLILGDSSLNDPNTLALTALMGVPLWMTLVADRSRLMLTRMAAVLMILPILVATLMTGSRGTMVGAFLVGLYVLKRSSLTGKAGLLALGGMGALLAGTFLSDNIFQRYQAVVSSDVAVAGDSTDSRLHLAKQGLILFSHRPIFGVGLGMFAVAENDLARAQGSPNGTWHTAHNMYLEVLSETGLISFGVYLWILYGTWKTLGALERVEVTDHPYARQIRTQAFWLRISFLLFCTAGLFLSIGLGPYFSLLTALPLAFSWIVARESSTAGAEAQTEVREAPQRAPLPAAFEAPIRGLRDSV